MPSFSAALSARGHARFRRAAGAAILTAGLVLAVAAPVSADPGTLDPAFAAAIGTGFDNSVLASTTQSDGDLLFGGRFGGFNGTTSKDLIRLHPDGSVDTAFSASLGTSFSGGDVRAVAQQSDGKIVVGGEFASFDGTSAPGLVRLNADGTLDTAFMTAIGSGVAGSVYAVTVAADGSITIGGSFASVNITAVSNLAHLHADGSVDTAFGANLGTGFDGIVWTLATQPDGSVLVGGAFSIVDGVADIAFARLGSNGAPDTAFDSHFTAGSGAALAVAVQGDGKILVGGNFTVLQGVLTTSLTRVNADGTHDATFAAQTGFDGAIRAIALETDGSAVVGGDFTANAPVGSRLSLVSSAGAVDQAFTDQLGAGVDATVWALTPTTAGRVIAAGEFTTQRVTRIGTSSAANPSDPGSGELARTGSTDAWPLGLLACGLLSIGLAALAISLRRRRASV